MIINDREAAARLSSPGNLMNRLKDLSANGSNKSNTSDKRNKAMSLFIPPAQKPQTFNPFTTPNPAVTATIEDIQEVVETPTKLDDILANSESQIQLGLAHDKALKLLNQSVEMLSTKLEDVKPEKLASVIAAASKTVESIRKERNEASKNNKDREVHYHFYTPEQQKVSDYEIVEVQ